MTRSAMAFLLLAACGSPATLDQPVGGAAGDEMPAENSCEGYSEGDACITAENLAQCERMAAECPGEMQVLESCPLQFACPGEALNDAEQAPSSEFMCEGRTVEDDCMDAAALASCQEMQARCPGAVMTAESCPLQFSCPN